MITIYHLGISQSDRIVWLMEELGLPYQLEWYDRDEQGLAPAEYRALHPVGTAPIIRDGDLVLSDSAAIAEYISQKHANGALSVTPEEPDYPHYLFWMQFNNNIQCLFFLRRALPEGSLTTSQALMETLVNRREKGYFSYLDQRLGDSDYLGADRFTCADIMAAFNLTTLSRFAGWKIDDMPNVGAYVERISSRPAYQKAMSLVGPNASRPRQS